MGSGTGMKICVFGLWHLGSVTSACLASKGFNVTGLDSKKKTIDNLKQGKAPLFEPGLDDLLKSGLRDKNLDFTTDKEEAVKKSEVVWVTFDTPVDEDDKADVEFVENEIRSIFPFLKNDTDVLISSQLPVGSTSKLKQEYQKLYPGNRVSFFYSPENLRLGKAIDAFTNPERIVAGAENTAGRERIDKILNAFCDRIEWMSVESAEMSKHALNSFLATSVTFINELAGICEEVGANAREVERALKSESRIGPGAYLKPGAAFAGGTLARDIQFLTDIGEKFNIPTHLLSAVQASNNEHKNWAKRKLKSMLGSLAGKTISVLGLTYKPGTDTLRRSESVELCKWIYGEGGLVLAHDPAVKRLPDELNNVIGLCREIESALKDSSAVVIGTEWKEYKKINADEIISQMKKSIIIDPAGFLAETLGQNPEIQYATVGKP